MELEPEAAGGTGEPGAAPSPGCSPLSCEEHVELVLAASPCCDAEGIGSGERDEAPRERSPEPAEEAAGEPTGAWRRNTAAQDGTAAQHDPPLWLESPGAGATLQLGRFLASPQPGERRQLEEEEVLRQPLFARAKKLFESWLRSPDSTKAPAPVHKDVLKEFVITALHNASVTPAPTWAPSTPEHPRPAQLDLPPSFLQRMIQKLGLKMPGRREAPKP